MHTYRFRSLNGAFWLTDNNNGKTVVVTVRAPNVDTAWKIAVSNDKIRPIFQARYRAVIV